MTRLLTAATAASLVALPLTGCSLTVEICRDLDVTLSDRAVTAGDPVAVTVDTVTVSCADRGDQPAPDLEGPALIFLLEPGSGLIASSVGVPLDEDGHGVATLETSAAMVAGSYDVVLGGFVDEGTSLGRLEVSAP
ncbi:hypothetical protein [Demequina iriomotensis]|uniref:hypothetical protein n=1 Tax=Demequina iriomotensis TaxID=1536641 RepID=UPI000780889F|nr:hypothetical protein [Demequina iriomotensis]